MLKPCLTCGALSHGSRCPAHAHRPRNTPNRSGYRQAEFRAAVLERAGHRCQAIINGVRCTVTDPLEAHHLDPLRDHATNDPERGLALCRHHHRIVEQLPGVRGELIHEP
jgi:predicted restriction endonuclease